MKRAFAHPTVESVKAIHAEVLAAHGGAEGIRDRVLLESAVAAPQARMLGEPLLTDPVEIAAAYLFYLWGNHPFVDGNKQTALATCLVFLSANDSLGNEVPNTDGWEEMVRSVASGQWDREQTTKCLRRLLLP